MIKTRQTLPALSRRALLGGMAISFGGLLLPGPARAMIEMSRLPGIAVSGFDPVASFTEGRARMGSDTIIAQHQGVEWRFSSAANRALFLANPARYAPQFGGFCSWAVSQGYTAPADPEAWAIHDGRLYLNYDFAIRDRWATDIPGHIALGNRNWPALATAQ